MSLIVPHYPSQGQKIALGWNNTSGLRDWTSILGADGLPFPPPDDRNGYTDGVDRLLPTGVVLMAGRPISRQTFPWLSYGQIQTLQSTYDGQNVTVAVHKSTSLSKTATSNFNAVVVVDMNQATSLKRTRGGYEGYVVKLILVEAL